MTQRHALIDALRGLALFGILLVNIQSYCWGVGGPTLGILTERNSLADQLTVLATAFLLEFKIYPLFCFCFGYGFAVMARRWAWRDGHPSGVDVETRFRRRLGFMLWMGLAHGLFIWFGDILARYAMAAWFMAPHMRARPRRLVRLLRMWSIALIATTVLSVLMVVVMGTPEPGVDQEALIDGVIANSFETYVYADAMPQLAQRMGDYLTILFGWLFLFPQAVVLFLLGALVCQLGWLRNPARHLARWRAIGFWSLIAGLPLAALFAHHAWRLANTPTLAPTAWEVIVLSAAPVLSPAYVAALALSAASHTGKWLVHVFAPAGRMALTNYLTQSVAMAFMMSTAPFGLVDGSGLGLAESGQFVIALSACALFAAQLVFSHWWLRHHTQGPMEALWRRHTYRTEK